MKKTIEITDQVAQTWKQHSPAKLAKADNPLQTAYYAGTYDVILLLSTSFPHMSGRMVEAYVNGMMKECEKYLHARPDTRRRDASKAIKALQREHAKFLARRNKRIKKKRA